MDVRCLDNGYVWVFETATGVYTGRGEFFTGVRSGDIVTVKRGTCHRPDGSAGSVYYSVSKGGASLSVHREDVTVTGEWE